MKKRRRDLSNSERQKLACALQETLPQRLKPALQLVSGPFVLLTVATWASWTGAERFNLLMDLVQALIDLGRLDTVPGEWLETAPLTLAALYKATKG